MLKQVSHSILMVPQPMLSYCLWECRQLLMASGPGICKLFLSKMLALCPPVRRWWQFPLIMRVMSPALIFTNQEGHRFKSEYTARHCPSPQQNNASKCLLISASQKGNLEMRLWIMLHFVSNMMCTGEILGCMCKRQSTELAAQGGGGVGYAGFKTALYFTNPGMLKGPEQPMT